MTFAQNLDHPCSKCVYSDASIWANLAGKSVPELNRAFDRRTFEAGQVVFHQGDASAGLYCVSAGVFALRTLHTDGASMMVRLAYPGDVIGFRSFLKQDVHKTEARALVAGRICSVPEISAQSIVARNPSVFGRLTERCLEEIDAMRTALFETSLLSKKQVFLRIILTLTEQIGDFKEDKATATLPVSRGELADMVGVAPESISRIISRLHNEELIQLSGRKISIPSLSAVRSACAYQTEEKPALALVK